MSRAYTAEEARNQFMRHIAGMAKYWANLPDIDKATGNELTTLGRLNGLAFSILNVFDGTSMAMPALDISLAPHPDDKEFLKGLGDNWYEPGMIINETMLHEEWKHYERGE